MHRRPKAFLLENVKQLKGHDKGKTLKTLLDVLSGKSNIDKKELNKLIAVLEEARGQLA